MGEVGELGLPRVVVDCVDYLRNEGEPFFLVSIFLPSAPRDAHEDFCT